MRSIQGTPVGLGSVTPSLQEVTDRPYRYKRRPGWRDDDPSVFHSDPDPGTGAGVKTFAGANTERHQHRLTRYEELMKAEPGLSHAEAARRMGLAPRTIRGYAAKLAEQAGPVAPGCRVCVDPPAGCQDCGEAAS